MFLLNSITLYQFKNYLHRQFVFNERIVGICGKNGVGKTNLLDAVHYLCFTKSYFSRTDQISVLSGHEGFRVEGMFRLHDVKEHAVCILRENGKKEFSVNEQPYKRFSEHIGRYPCVVIAPDDIQLIIGSSEDRRTFIDTLISQIDHDYLHALISYTKILQQRNSFLKAYADHFNKDLSVLDILDDQLASKAAIIYDTRKKFLFSFLPAVKHLYNEISQQYEDINLLYESELDHAGMAALLKTNRQKDLLVQRTSSGVHRDELLFLLHNQLFRNIASQGQRKSLLFALKLAVVDVIYEKKSIFPLLLLDDVFEKLDESRIMNLLQKVTANEAMQIFITDTNESRLTVQMKQLTPSFQLISL